MTQKEFFNKVITLTSDKEMVEFATQAIAKIDLKNEKAKATRIAKSAENEPIMAEITKYLGNHKSALGNEIACACGISTNKAIALCNKLVDNGTIAKVVVSIPKVGKRNSYSLVVVEEEISNDQ